jgi:hypothetical protein
MTVGTPVAIGRPRVRGLALSSTALFASDAPVDAAQLGRLSRVCQVGSLTCRKGVNEHWARLALTPSNCTAAAAVGDLPMFTPARFVSLTAAVGVRCLSRYPSPILQQVGS